MKTSTFKFLRGKPNAQGIERHNRVQIPLEAQVIPLDVMSDFRKMTAGGNNGLFAATDEAYNVFLMLDSAREDLSSAGYRFTLGYVPFSACPNMGAFVRQELRGENDRLPEDQRIQRFQQAIRKTFGNTLQEQVFYFPD